MKSSQSKLLLDISLGDITNPSTWFWFRAEVQGLGHAHFCTLLEASVSEDAATVDLEILFMRSFASNGRAIAKELPHAQLFLPLSFSSGEIPLPTPAGFGGPLARPKLQPLRETCVVSWFIQINAPASFKVLHTSFGRIKLFAKLS